MAAGAIWARTRIENGWLLSGGNVRITLVALPDGNLPPFGPPAWPSQVDDNTGPLSFRSVDRIDDPVRPAGSLELIPQVFAVKSDAEPLLLSFGRGMQDRDCLRQPMCHPRGP